MKRSLLLPSEHGTVCLIVISPGPTKDRHGERFVDITRCLRREELSLSPLMCGQKFNQINEQTDGLDPIFCSCDSIFCSCIAIVRSSVAILRSSGKSICSYFDSVEYRAACGVCDAGSGVYESFCDDADADDDGDESTCCSFHVKSTSTSTLSPS